VSKPRVRFWLGVAVLALGALGLLAPARAAAAGDPDDKATKLFDDARSLESREDWRKACRLYWQVLRTDPTNTEVRERLQVCLRHVHLLRRHHDDETFRKAVFELKPDAALAVYRKVLEAIHGSYLDRDKVSQASLVSFGLQELRFALHDDVFVHTYLANATPQKIRAFEADLEQWPDLSKVTDAAKALRLASSVTRKAQDDLDVTSTGAVAIIFELICGAVNALDEYSYFLTPGDLLAGGKSMNSVEDLGLLMEEIGYVKILDFRPNTVQELQAALMRLRNEGMKGLILDLRGNPGGSFEAAIAVAELFLPSGYIAHTQSRRPDLNHSHKANNADALLLPLVVLIDGDTASAAEVLAVALKENQRATLVGQTTFGKCTLQWTFQLEIKLPGKEKKDVKVGYHITLAKYLSPASCDYTGRGIAPSPSWEMDDPARQLDTAVLAVRQLLMMAR
jgi:hypothetical protein